MKTSFLKATGAAILLAMSIGACKLGDSTPWIWKIDGRKLTVGQMEDAYNGFVFLMAQQLQMTPDQLKEIVQNPDKIADPRMARQAAAIAAQLDKENFVEQYKQITLLNAEARKKGFMKDEKMKARLEFMKKYMLANMFLIEQMKSQGVEISDEEAVSEWEKIRKQYPNAKSVPLDEGIEIAKNQLKMKMLQGKQQEFLKNITEAYKIETNDKFDLKDYLAAEKKQEDEKEESNKKKKKK